MFRKILAGTAAFMKYLAATLIGAIIVINLAAVVMRYFLNRPLMWCEEASLILFAWAVFCSLAPIVHKRSGIALDYFVDLMPEAMRRIVSILMGLMGSAMLIATCVFCLDLMRRSLYRFSPLLLIPYRHVYLATVIGMGLSAVILLVHAYDDARALARGASREQE